MYDIQQATESGSTTRDVSTSEIAVSKSPSPRCSYPQQRSLGLIRKQGWNSTHKCSSHGIADEAEIQS